MAAEDVPGEADTRTPTRGDAIAEGGAGAIPCQPADAKSVHALRIDEGEGSRLGQGRFDVADVAGAVSPGAEELRAQAQVQSQVRRGFPVILRKDRVIVLAVLVVVDAAAAKAELGRALYEILEI